jgi:very-short-patch-repair endonuclease
MQQKPRKQMLAKARELRGDATGPERKLWHQLRDMKQLGYHFRRQAPFRSYILDFVEHTHRLVIELDGDQHALPENEARDVERDRLLESEGYLVLRWPNSDVTTNLDRTMEYLLHVLKERSPTRIASLSDLPTRGRCK